MPPAFPDRLESGGFVGPDVGGEEPGDDVVACLCRRRGRAGVERLEQVGWRVDAERITEGLGFGRGVASIADEIVGTDGELLLHGQVEERRRDGEHLVDEVRIDAVSGDGEKPDRATGFVDLRGHLVSGVFVTVEPGAQIDRYGVGHG